VGKKVIVSVINDLVSDQRVHRTCSTLYEMGLEVCLVGRETRRSIALEPRLYKTHRMKLFFEKGALFYAEYNLRLFLYLLFHRYSILHSNDLDTLLANFLSQKIKGGELVYDSHEYFLEVPELVNRPKVKRTWERIENFIFPKLKYVFTVNKSIADIYQKQYAVNMKIMRNVPVSQNKTQVTIKSRSELGLPDDKTIILLQGAGINVDRGSEEMLTAMQWIDAVFLIVGTGDVLPQLKEMVKLLKLEHKVVFTGRVPFQKLMEYTAIADVGVTLDKDTNLNYKFSLPNKLFDYIHADLPVIASNLIEVKRVISEYKVGLVLSNHEPEEMAKEITAFLQNETLFSQTKINTLKAKSLLNWEVEKKVLIKEYELLIG
jgi:glycosyltransferase involved in cell wall biosynthesis